LNASNTVLPVRSERSAAGIFIDVKQCYLVSVNDSETQTRVSGTSWLNLRPLSGSQPTQQTIDAHHSSACRHCLSSPVWQDCSWQHPVTMTTDAHQLVIVVKWTF